MRIQADYLKSIAMSSKLNACGARV